MVLVILDFINEEFLLIKSFDELNFQNSLF